MRSSTNDVHFRNGSDHTNMDTHTASNREIERRMHARGFFLPSPPAARAVPTRRRRRCCCRRRRAAPVASGRLALLDKDEVRILRRLRLGLRLRPPRCLRPHDNTSSRGDRVDDVTETESSAADAEQWRVFTTRCQSCGLVACEMAKRVRSPGAARAGRPSAQPAPAPTAPPPPRRPSPAPPSPAAARARPAAQRDRISRHAQTCPRVASYIDELQLNHDAISRA